MNKPVDEVHVLVKELLPVYDEADEEAKAVIDKHLMSCEECRKNLVINKSGTMKALGESGDETHEIKPFRKLNSFKKLVTAFILLSRVIIIGLVAYSFNSSFNPSIPTGIQFEGLRATLMIFYWPFSFLSLLVIGFMRNKKILFLTLIFDLLIIIYLDKIVRLLLGV